MSDERKSQIKGSDPPSDGWSSIWQLKTNYKQMKEEFLQFVWKQELFQKDEIATTDGQPIEIIATGQPNNDSGPDFFNARIKIGETVWAGNIEIHQKSSHWYLHHHHNDAAYNNVILHVVELDDQEVKVKNHELPTLVLSYPETILRNYETLLKSEQWIPCEDKVPLIDPFVLRIWFSSLMIERLQSKTGEILTVLSQNQNNWNETFYQLLSRNFGMKTNSLPFELLAKSVPLKILSKHKSNLIQTEALLFGQAGLLQEVIPSDKYYTTLKNEYDYLQKKYSLNPIEPSIWKFMRMRPINFPSIRIAQLAMLVHHSSALFSHVLEAQSINDLHQLFNVSASEYWNNHYRFGKISDENRPKQLGDSAFNNLIINTIAPILFVYGEQHLDQTMKDRALLLLEMLPTESNQIIRQWNELGIESHTAFESQSLLQLKNVYCNHKKCLNCQLGAKIITSVNPIFK